MKCELPQLGYAYNALEPYIDAQTMEIHHTKHHQTYLDKMNAVLEKYPQLADRPLEDLMQSLAELGMDEADQKIFKNQGGGYLNHNVFWQIMNPSNARDEKLVADIEQTFGSIEEFKKQFTQLAITLFGSGWVWLVRDSAEVLKLYVGPMQDSPHLKGDTPIIGLDVWEHAYYLKYQNRRPEYIEAWWNTIKLI